MNKIKLLVVAGVLAAPVTVVADTAEAGPRLSRLFRVAHALRVLRHSQPRIYVYRRSTVYRTTTFRERTKYQEKYTQRREPTTMPKKSAHNEAAPGAVVGIKQTDARGRVYDPASMAWFDGGTQCWTGTQTWTFKNNAWFYGNSRWYPGNGSWQADTADPPAPVACETIPAFAAVTPLPQETARYDPSNTPPMEKSETKSARSPTADRPANCNKYLAVIGQTVSVPCDSSVAEPATEREIATPAAKLAPTPTRVAEPTAPAPIAPTAMPTAGEPAKHARIKTKRRMRDDDDD